MRRGGAASLDAQKEEEEEEEEEEGESILHRFRSSGTTIRSVHVP